MSRALLVCAVPQARGIELVRDIAGEFDVVIGVDAGGAVCLRAGVTPMLVVGDFDSIDAAALDEVARMGVPIRSYPTDKDRTDIDLAIGEARDLGATEIAVTAATAERLDHTLGVVAALAGAGDLSPRLLEPDLNGWILSSAGHAAVTLDGIGATVSVLALTPSARVSARGVRWPLELADISSVSTMGISNVVSVNGAMISVDAGIALVLSPRTDVAPAVESRSPSNGTGTTR